MSHMSHPSFFSGLYNGAGEVHIQCLSALLEHEHSAQGEGLKTITEAPSLFFLNCIVESGNTLFSLTISIRASHLNTSWGIWLLPYK